MREITGHCVHFQPAKCLINTGRPDHETYTHNHNHNCVCLCTCTGGWPVSTIFLVISSHSCSSSHYRCSNWHNWHTGTYMCAKQVRCTLSGPNTRRQSGPNAVLSVARHSACPKCALASTYTSSWHSTGQLTISEVSGMLSMAGTVQFAGYPCMQSYTTTSSTGNYGRSFSDQCP